MKFKKIIAVFSLAAMCITNVFAMNTESSKITELRNYMIEVSKRVVSPENTNPFVSWLKEENICDAPNIYRTWAYSWFDMTHCGEGRPSREHKEKFRNHVIKTLKAVNVVPYSLDFFWAQQKYGDLYWLLRAHNGGMTSWTYKILNDYDLLSHENTVMHIRNVLRGIENRPDFFGNCYIGALIAANKCAELGLEWAIVSFGDNDHWDCVVGDGNDHWDCVVRDGNGTTYIVNFIGCVSNLVCHRESSSVGTSHYGAVQPLDSPTGWFVKLNFGDRGHDFLEDASAVRFEDKTPFIDFFDLIYR